MEFKCTFGQSDAWVVKTAGEGEGSEMQNLHHQRN